MCKLISFSFIGFLLKNRWNQTPKTWKSVNTLHAKSQMQLYVKSSSIRILIKYGVLQCTNWTYILIFKILKTYFWAFLVPHIFDVMNAKKRKFVQKMSKIVLNIRHTIVQYQRLFVSFHMVLNKFLSSKSGMINFKMDKMNKCFIHTYIVQRELLHWSLTSQISHYIKRNKCSQIIKTKEIRILYVSFKLIIFITMLWKYHSLLCKMKYSIF